MGLGDLLRPIGCYVGPVGFKLVLVILGLILDLAKMRRGLVGCETGHNSLECVGL